MATTVEAQKTLLLVESTIQQLSIPKITVDEVVIREPIKGTTVMTTISLSKIKRKFPKGMVKKEAGLRRTPVNSLGIVLIVGVTLSLIPTAIILSVLFRPQKTMTRKES